MTLIKITVVTVFSFSISLFNPLQFLINRDKKKKVELNISWQLDLKEPSLKDLEIHLIAIHLEEFSLSKYHQIVLSVCIIKPKALKGKSLI